MLLDTKIVKPALNRKRSVSLSKALLHSRDTLLHRSPRVSSSRTVLQIVTPYSLEGRHFFQSVRGRWHITENDPQLHSIWPNHPTTAYHKTESLKNILVHSRQAKPTSLRSTHNKFCQ